MDMDVLKMDEVSNYSEICEPFVKEVLSITINANEYTGNDPLVLRAFLDAISLASRLVKQQLEDWD